MINKHKNDSIHHVWCFHWSACLRVGSWGQCIWFGFLGSKLIRSNNQARATLWLLETCLIVGLVPFMIILITASLSSNTYNKASWCEELTFNKRKSALSRSWIIPWNFFCIGDLDKSSRSWLFWYVFPWRTATVRSHTSSAGFPSNLNPASKEMISDSVELCETEVCFLHIQHIGTNVWLPKTNIVPSRSGFWVLKISCKIRVLKQSQSALFLQNSPHNNTVYIHMCDGCKISKILSFVTSFGPFRERSCKLSTDHRISGLPVRAKF